MRISPGIKNEDLQRSVFYMQNRLSKHFKESTTLTNFGKPTLPNPQSIHAFTRMPEFERFESQEVSTRRLPLSHLSKGHNPTFSPFPCASYTPQRGLFQSWTRRTGIFLTKKGEPYDFQALIFPLDLFVEYQENIIKFKKRT